MRTRFGFACIAALVLATPAMSQPLQPLVNSGFEERDLAWFTPRPIGYRMYNTTEYRQTDDGQLPAPTTRNSSVGAIRLPGALGQAFAQFTAVHSEEFRDPSNPLSGRNWPEYTFDPVAGRDIRVSCWFNIPASDPLVGGLFGMKVCFLRSGSNFSCYQEFEWLAVDPSSATPFPGTTAVALVEPPAGSGLTAGPGLHTNGQWVKFERIVRQSDFGAFPTPPTNPARASIQALRFSVDTNSYGTVWVDDVNFEEVVPAPTCAADFNNSGTRDVADIFAFLTAWFANAPGSDFNNSGTRDVADIFAFLTAWFAGCP